MYAAAEVQVASDGDECMRLQVSWRCLALALTAALLGGFSGFGIARVIEPRRWPDLSFTADKWKVINQDERYVFWNDIQRRRLLADKPYVEVLQMLGAPSWDAPDHRRITYVIKTGRGESTFNFVYLMDIRFNPAGRVADTAITTD